ncbi:hypothetical protein [Consotaella salsifontis]|uniref:Uncharacterized protein n=1 Tax=Consotaella salsifontis TaxID=1365950 RepID=A0A1T4ST15_9HYPH|nr:hypothetical protein [Consotaella salsifontis]SKA31041.1 hypothetical protein SAMN05428963_113106 [Consotaella salsifontis]
MKIKMISSVAGVDFALSPGDETDRFGDAEAIRMIEAGFAIPVAGQEMERTVVDHVAERRGRKGKSNVVSGNGDDTAGH